MPWPITNILILQHKLNLKQECKRLCALQSKDTGTFNEKQTFLLKISDEDDGMILKKLPNIYK